MPKFDFNHIDIRSGLPKIKDDRAETYINTMNLCPNRSCDIILLQNRSNMRSIGNIHYQTRVHFNKSDNSIIYNDGTTGHFFNAKLKNGERAYGWIYADDIKFRRYITESTDVSEVSYLNDDLINDADNNVEDITDFEMSKLIANKLYKKIMRKISKYIKKAISEIILDDEDDIGEDYNVLGVRVKSLNQQKLSDFDDINKPVQFKDLKFTKYVLTVFEKNYKFGKYSLFLKLNIKMKINWTYKLEHTACTDGINGGLYMNPEMMQNIYNNCGDLGIMFIILHEAAHNYYNNVKHAPLSSGVQGNIMSDRLVNHEILLRWPEFKDIINKIGALI